MRARLERPPTRRWARSTRPARWAVVTDFNTGATLLDKEADVQMPPSSMTKLMTAYLVYGMLKLGRLQLTQGLPVSEKAWRMQGSKLFVPLNGTVTVEDLIRGMIIDSGNDACIVLAEGIAGSEDQFVELMNKKAAELGLTNSHFANCTGWPDATHHMSMRDIATLAAHIIRDFPEYYHYDKETTFKYNGIEQQNRNTLVQKGLADGLKTGHTDAGGFGLVASADRAGRRIIVVVNGCTSMHMRTEEGEKLLEWGFREFENVTLFTAADTVETVKVWLGTQSTVPLVGGTRSGDHHAEAVAQHRKGGCAIQSARAGADQQRRHAGQAGDQRQRRAANGGASAGRRRCAATRLARARRGRAEPLRSWHLRAGSSSSRAVRGAGKGSVVASLTAALRAEGHAVLDTREPGGTPEGLHLRALLLAASGTVWEQEAELLLMVAARIQHVRRVIQPALAAGTHVVCDRFVGSTLAYQGAGRGMDPALILDLHRRLVDDTAPDLTVVLDIDPRVGLDRSRRRLAATGLDEGRFEDLALAFHDRVRQSFLAQAAEAPGRSFVIDAGQALETVQRAVLDRVHALLG